MEFIGFVFELFLILGNEFLYVRLLRFIPVKSYLARRESFIDFFKPVPSGKHFPFKFPYHCLKSLDCFFRLFCLFSQFADIVSLVQMLNIAPNNAITTLQPILATDLLIK